MVSKRKVYLRVLESTLHTVVSFVTMTILMVAVVAVSFRFGAAKLVLPIMYLTAAIGVVAFLASEVIIQLVYRADRADPAEYPDLYEAIDRLCEHCWYLPKSIVRPRIYILNMGDVPNAAAFGCGLFWQYGVGITKPLYELLTPRELESVLAHEIAHIRCKDVGVMTALALILGGAEQISRIFLGGKTSLGKGPAAILLGAFFFFLAKVIFPVGTRVIAQQREYAADALGALYVNSPEPLITALLKLSSALPADNSERSPLDDIFLTHPRVEKRLEALRALTVRK